MDYEFVNNFEQELAAGVTDVATTMSLNGGGALLTGVTADNVVTLTLVDTTTDALEIVLVTAVAGNDVTVTRGAEGTTARAWDAGTPVYNRVTAGAINEVFSRPHPVKQGTVTSGDSFTQAWGLNAEASGNSSLAIGEVTTQALGNFAFAIANGTAGEKGVAVGFGTAGLNAVSVGNNNAVWQRSVGVGSDIYAQEYYVTCLGPLCSSFGVNGISIGHYANADVRDSVAIGPGIETSIVGGYRCGAVPYISATPDAHYANAFPGFGAGDFTAPPVTRRNTPYVVIATDDVDLTTAADFAELAMPTGTRLFMDTLDIVITSSATPGGTPDVTVGPDGVSPAAYLAATAVTGTAVGGRQSETPLVTDGVTSVRMTTGTAGTGTLTAKLVVRGYLMEL